MTVIDRLANLPVVATDPVAADDLLPPEPTGIPIDWVGMIADLAVLTAVTVCAVAFVSVLVNRM